MAGIVTAYIRMACIRTACTAMAYVAAADIWSIWLWPAYAVADGLVICAGCSQGPVSWHGTVGLPEAPKKKGTNHLEALPPLSFVALRTV